MSEKTPREELEDAIRILKEDGFHVRKHIQAELDARGFVAKVEDPPKGEPPKPPDEPGEGDPPPPKDPPADPPAKKDWWWKDR